VKLQYRGSEGKLLAAVSDALSLVFGDELGVEVGVEVGFEVGVEVGFEVGVEVGVEFVVGFAQVEGIVADESFGIHIRSLAVKVSGQEETQQLSIRYPLPQFRVSSCS